jgi:integrase
MRIYKISYKDKSGESHEVAKWWLELRDHKNIVRRFPGFIDKGATESLGKQIKRLIECRASSEPIDPALSRWLERVPGKLRMRFAKIGLIDEARAFGGKPLSEHLDSFCDSLKSKSRSNEYVDLMLSRIKAIFDGCKFIHWGDISAARIGVYLDGLEQSKKTRNDYQKSIKQFCRWMVSQRRASESPLEHFDCVHVKAEDIKHKRRALEPDEARRLLEAAAAGPESFGMSGPERSLLYRLAIETGLRANELRSLHVESFDFEQLTVKVESQDTKNRQEALLPLRADTAANLRQFFTGKLPGVKAFGGRYKQLSDKTHLFIKADLEAAGIAYVDESGRYADFHSLRHTCGTFLAAAGVHPKTAQTIMRHSDINLTMSRYTHTLTGQESQAVESLTDLSQPSRQAQQAKATGTDDRKLGANLAFSTGQSGIVSDDMGQSKRIGDKETANLACARSSTGQSAGLRTRRLQVRLLSGAVICQQERIPSEYHDQIWLLDFRWSLPLRGGDDNYETGCSYGARKASASESGTSTP